MSDKIIQILSFDNHNSIAENIKEILIADDYHGCDKIIINELSVSSLNDNSIESLFNEQNLYVIILGAPLSWSMMANDKIRENGSECKVIIGGLNESSLYVFTDYGIRDIHMSLSQYLAIHGSDTLKLDDKNNGDSLFDSNDSILSVLLSSMIAPQISVSKSVESQLYVHEIKDRIKTDIEYENETIVIVGCGSLGYMIVKNLVPIGYGHLILIDSDDVHNFNVNPSRKLFVNTDIGKPKCDVIRDYVSINYPNVNVEVHHSTVQRLSIEFAENLKEKNGLLICAVDNVDTKRYLNQICLCYCIPFIDTGIDGHKFHIEVFVPHHTESYFSHNDPADFDYPPCVIKSFPSIIEHCIEWALQKFELWFMQNPKRAKNWNECIKLSRIQFEKSFNHSARQLLYSVPLDRKNEDGTNFWDAKNAPNPIVFSPNDEINMLFVVSFAKLIAIVNRIQPEESNDCVSIINSMEIPAFVLNKDKVIVTDPNEVVLKRDENVDKTLRQFVYSKDNEMHHKFIYAASNLRALMYGIPVESETTIWQLSNKVICCSFSSLKAVSSLVSLETRKLSNFVKFGKYENAPLNMKMNRNYFANLQFTGLFVTFDGALPKITHLTPIDSYTEWDSWTINERVNGVMTLDDVLNELKGKSGLECTMVVTNSGKTIYVNSDLIPIYAKRKKQAIRDLLLDADAIDVPKFIALMVTFEGENDDICGPRVKFYFSN